MRFYADVRIEWGVDMDANSEEEFVSLLKASYKDEYNNSDFRNNYINPR